MLEPIYFNHVSTYSCLYFRDGELNADVSSLLFSSLSIVFLNDCRQSFKVAFNFRSNMHAPFQLKGIRFLLTLIFKKEHQLNRQ